MPEGIFNHTMHPVVISNATISTVIAPAIQALFDLGAIQLEVGADKQKVRALMMDHRRSSSIRAGFMMTHELNHSDPALLHDVVIQTLMMARAAKQQNSPEPVLIGELPDAAIHNAADMYMRSYEHYFKQLVALKDDQI